MLYSILTSSCRAQNQHHWLADCTYIVATATSKHYTHSHACAYRKYTTLRRPQRRRFDTSAALGCVRELAALAASQSTLGHHSERRFCSLVPSRAARVLRALLFVRFVYVVVVVVPHSDALVRVNSALDHPFTEFTLTKT